MIASLIHSVVSQIKEIPADLAFLSSVNWSAIDSTHVLLLAAALFAALAFEFVNGFHDTANAVATVIYTKSLRPNVAVVWSGFCNFLGVFVGGTVVAMAILKLLPPEILAQQNMSLSLAMVFALLCSAILWNVGTWYLGLPASSSHTLIGAILGVGLAHASLSGKGIMAGMNWAKAGDIGMALLVSPLVGFSLAAGLLYAVKWLFKHEILHVSPKGDKAPPWPVRALLVATSGGVSMAHGSNDGQKGVGLVMLILITVLPAQFALRPNVNLEEVQKANQASSQLSAAIESAAVEAQKPMYAKVEGFRVERLFFNQAQAAAEAAQILPVSAGEVEATNKLKSTMSQISTVLGSVHDLGSMSGAEKFNLRSKIQSADGSISKLEKMQARITQTPQWAEIKAAKKTLTALTDYAPAWVIMAIAIALGLGTMIGWKRIVITIGEKIGKGHMTYAQGASAEMVAMSTIGLSAVMGLPVSTTHVLSSGIAGTMVANRSGVQSTTVKKIAAAWIFTLPASVLLSAGFYHLFVKLFV